VLFFRRPFIPIRLFPRFDSLAFGDVLDAELEENNSWIAEVAWIELTDPARRKPRHFHSRPAEARTVNESAVTHSFILRVLAPPQKTRSAPLILRLAAGM